MPMRVKTPWIEALNKSREEKQSKPPKSAEPDLRPKKMSDTFYSAVSLLLLLRLYVCVVWELMG